MPILTYNSTTSNIESSQAQLSQRRNAEQTDEEFSQINLQDNASELPQGAGDMINFQRDSISSKDQQIQKLTQELLHTTINYSHPKTTLAQQQQQLQQQQSSKVAQLIRQNTQLKAQNISLRQKMTLFQQVNSRQYDEVVNLQNQKSSLVEKISSLEQDLRVELSSREMKLAEMTMEIAEHRRKNRQLQKDILLLKALVKELEEDQQEEEDQQLMCDRQCGDSYDCCQSNKISATVQHEKIHQNHHENHQRDCLHILVKQNQNPYPKTSHSSLYSSNSSNQTNFEEEICFM